MLTGVVPVLGFHHANINIVGAFFCDHVDDRAGGRWQRHPFHTVKAVCAWKKDVWLTSSLHNCIEPLPVAQTAKAVIMTKAFMAVIYEDKQFKIIL